VSGFNLYPTEIDEIAMICPDVLEVAAVGHLSSRTDKQVVLYVVKKTASLNEERLLSHCCQHLTTHKAPHQVCFISALPKSNMGKIWCRERREKATT
jgi:long-chain acyl-CoA synthetase